MSDSRENVFFLGLGGMGMAPLALYLDEAGCRVRGCDDHWREPIRRLLEQRGIAATPCEELPPDISRVVYSSAIAAEHPLLCAARARGLDTLRRGEMLAEMVRGRRLIAVVGSHGKTTTTALLIHALRAAGHDFGYLLGALFADPSTPPARHATAPWVAAEVDESDGTIDHFAPEITVAVNFDWDHADRYRTEAELEATFINLFRRTRQLVLLPQWDARLRRLAETAGTPFRTFGPEGDFSVRASGDDGARQRLALNGAFVKSVVEVPLGGDFNAANAAAALAAAHTAFGGIAAEPFDGYRGVSPPPGRAVAPPGVDDLCGLRAPSDGNRGACCATCARVRRAGCWWFSSRTATRAQNNLRLISPQCWVRATACFSCRFTPPASRRCRKASPPPSSPPRRLAQTNSPWWNPWAAWNAPSGPPLRNRRARPR